jgi:tetratricopeptide (TPR) repeat protein
LKQRGVAVRAATILLAGTLLGCLGGVAARAQDAVPTFPGVTGALSWAARAEILDPSGKTLRIVNGTILPDGLAVETRALAGAARVRIQTRGAGTWESAAVVSTHPLIGLSLLQLPELPPRPVVFPESGAYQARMRVFLLHGPGAGPDSLPARIYENFELTGFPDLCPIDAGTIGAAPAVDSTGRFLGVVCDLSEGPYKYGYIVPAGSVAQLSDYRTPPRSLAGLPDQGRPGFAEDTTATGLLFRGAVLTQIGRLDDARRFLHLAEERDPSRSEIYYWAGRALFAQEQYPQAAEEFMYAAGRDSANYQAWHRAGEALHLAADYAGAERAYLRAIRVNPGAARTYCTLGVLYLKMQRGREAEAAWRTSIRIDPRFQEGIAYYNLASEMKHQGRTAAVDSICREIAAVEPAWEQRLRDALEKKHH